MKIGGQASEEEILQQMHRPNVCLMNGVQSMSTV